MSSSDDEIDLDFDFWERPRLEQLSQALQTRLNGSTDTTRINDWEHIAKSLNLPAAVANSLECGVAQEFRRDLSKLTEYVFVGDAGSCESRLACNYHNVGYILQLFSHPQDHLWQEDEVGYKTVVLSAGKSVFGQELPSCVRFVQRAVEEQSPVLICCPDGNTWSSAVALAYWMLVEDPSHSLAGACDWYSKHRIGLCIDAAREALEDYEASIAKAPFSPGGKRKLMPGSPESPGKKAANAAAEQIEEFVL